MIGIGLGMFLNELVEKELTPLNEKRIAAGLKPFTAKEYFDASKNLTGVKPNEYSKAVIKRLTANTKAEIAALKAVPKGTFTNIVDDVAAKVAAPAVAAGAGLEAIRKRKNAVAAKETAAAEKVAATGTGVKNAVGGALDLTGLSKGGVLAAAALGTGMGTWDSLTAASENWGERNPVEIEREKTYIDPLGVRRPLMPNQIYNESDMWADTFRMWTDSQFYKDVGSTIGPNVMSGIRGALGSPEQMMAEGRTWVTNKALGYTPEEIGSSKILTGINAVEALPEAALEGLYHLGKGVAQMGNQFGRAIGVERVGETIGDIYGTMVYGGQSSITPKKPPAIDVVEDKWKDKK